MKFNPTFRTTIKPGDVFIALGEPLSLRGLGRWLLQGLLKRIFNRLLQPSG